MLSKQSALTYLFVTTFLSGSGFSHATTHASQTTTIFRGGNAMRGLQTIPSPPSGWTNPPNANWLPESGLNCYQSGLKANLTTQNSVVDVGCAASETDFDELIESIMVINPGSAQISIYAGFAAQNSGTCIRYPSPYTYSEGKNKLDSINTASPGLFNVECPKKAYQKCCFIVTCLSVGGCGNQVTVWSRIYDEVVKKEADTGLSVGARAGLGILGVFIILLAVSVFLHVTNIFRFYCFDCCAEACCSEKKSKRRGGGASSSYSVPSYPVMVNPSSSSYSPQPTGYPKTTLSSAGYGARSASGRDLTSNISADRSKVAGASTLTGKIGSSVGKSTSSLTSPSSSSSLSSPSSSSSSSSKSSKTLTAKTRYDDNFDDRPRRR